MRFSTILSKVSSLRVEIHLKIYPMQWLIRAYAFQITTYLTMYSFQNLANASLSFHRYTLTTHLHTFIIWLWVHVMLTRKRIWKQCYVQRQALGEVSSELLYTQVNPTVWEISGQNRDEECWQVRSVDKTKIRYWRQPILSTDKNLPKGAAAVDYAYMIHTDIGNKMVKISSF